MKNEVLKAKVELMEKGVGLQPLAGGKPLGGGNTGGGEQAGKVGTYAAVARGAPGGTNGSQGKAGRGNPTAG